jgi:iron(III) transport system ATP-binding protein
MSTQLNVNDVSIRFADHTVIQHVNFELQAGRIGCLLGPSGCGKTTMLRAIAGFQSVNGGSIILGDRQVADASFTMPPQDRHVGMVFQDFALYPHLNVEQNVAFGLNKWSKKDRAARADELLKLVKLEEMRHRYPHELSGGQQQRVALIRAMAPKPDILLMDEPFSSMDTELRQSLAWELRSILKQDNATAILVTHDQSEAFAMADDIGVMDSGRLVQWATAKELYFAPKTAFVAKFIGQSVMLEATHEEHGLLDTPLGLAHADYMTSVTQRVLIQLRPQDVVIDASSDIKATVVSGLYLGAEYLYTLKLSDGQTILCLAPGYSNYSESDQVGIRLKVARVPTYGLFE